MADAGSVKNIPSWIWNLIAMVAGLGVSWGVMRNTVGNLELRMGRIESLVVTVSTQGTQQEYLGREVGRQSDRLQKIEDELRRVTLELARRAP